MNAAHVADDQWANFGSARDAGNVVDPVPPAGSLGIRERRSWKTWQLVVVGVVCLLIGLAIDSGGGSASTSSNKGAYTLPPPAASGSSTSSTTPATSTTVATGTTPSSSTSTPTTTPVTGTPQVLLPPHQGRGDSITGPFTISGGSWNIGWAYQCSPLPASGPAFQVFVTPPGATPSGTAAVVGTAASGQSVTAQTGTGTEVLQIQSASSCIWVVKVTGVGTPAA